MSADSKEKRQVGREGGRERKKKEGEREREKEKREHALKTEEEGCSGFRYSFNLTSSIFPRKSYLLKICEP